LEDFSQGRCIKISGYPAIEGQRYAPRLLGNDDDGGIGFLGQADGGSMPCPHVTVDFTIHAEGKKASRRCDFPISDDHGTIVERGSRREDASDELFGYLCLQVDAPFDILPQPGVPFEYDEGSDFLAGQGERGPNQFLKEKGFLGEAHAPEEWVFSDGCQRPSNIILEDNDYDEDDGAQKAIQDPVQR